MSEPPASLVKLGYEAQITDLTRQLEIAQKVLERIAKPTGKYADRQFAWAQDVSTQALAQIDTKEN